MIIDRLLPVMVGAAAVALVAGCSVPDAAGIPEPRPSRPGHTLQTDRQAAPLPCEKPSTELLRWAAEALAPHPGPLLAATVVRVGTTPTGTWHVVGLERGYMRDDGSWAAGLDRQFGLVNARAPGRDAKLIRIGGRTSLTDDQVKQVRAAQPVWTDIAWRGEQRDRGVAAGRRAAECLSGPGARITR